jgi:hypothetical protein
MNLRDLLPGLGRSLVLPSETQAGARHTAQAAAELHDEAFLQYLRTQVKLPRFGPGLLPFVPVLPPSRPSDAMLRRYRDA